MKSTLFAAALALTFASVSVQTVFAAQETDTAANVLAVKLLQGLHEQSPKENIIVSPTSLTTVFHLLSAGAASGDQKSILKALGLDGVAMEDVLKDVAKFEKSLVKSPDYSISSKNLLYTNVALDPAYKTSVEKAFGAETSKVDFKDPATATAINAWADKSTDGLIKEMVKASEIAEVAFLGMNATFLDAKWAIPMDSPRRNDTKFLSDDGKPMMNGTEPVVVGLMTSDPGLPVVAVEYPQFTVYDVPYKAGANGEAQGSFQVLLPALLNKADVEKALWGGGPKIDPKLVPLSDVIAGLSAQTIEQIQADIATKRTKRDRSFMIHIPKFKAEYTSESDTLKALITKWGAGEIYGKIDLSPMVETAAKSQWSNSAVELIKQKAVIEVSETGTKAAAISVARAFPASCPPPQIYLDRPFAYLVKDTATGRIVFAGTYVDPTKAKNP